MDTEHEAIVVVRTADTAVESDEQRVELGQWYWVPDSDGDKQLECVTHVGSNYINTKSVWDTSHRIHLDELHEYERELHPERVIEGNIARSKADVRRLMGEVVALTARLGVGPSPELTAGSSDGAALARIDGHQDIKQYKSALVQAKEKDLPELFEKVEEANRAMSAWMKAESLPMKAQLSRMKGAIDIIDDRIFSVGLYAGLMESIVQVADGEPAALSEKVRLMQRRHYMDEECLYAYKAGGMEFKNIRKFDAWLRRPENLNRILPFPRCIVAFQVRRHDKWRPFHTYIEFQAVLGAMRADKMTFLYIRNGARLYRLDTDLEFGEQLFPDTQHLTETSDAKLWAHMGSDNVREIITDAQYQGILDEYAAEKEKHRAQKADHAREHKAWRTRKAAAKAKGQEFDEDEPWLHPFMGWDPKNDYHPFSPDSVYYDDIVKEIGNTFKRANRIAIVLQGLLDRSTVLHPHPPWKLWLPEGAAAALEMIYDDSRALAAGEKPSFEAYRERLNKSLKVGSVTVGQLALWEAEEKERRGAHGYQRYGHEGPPVVARVMKLTRKGRCTYAYARRGQSPNTYDKEIRALFSCPSSKVLNVDAYKPGDFKQFFADPRTREEYLEWAPLLLEAEEFHAGNRELADPPPPAARRPFSYVGERKRREKRARENMIGKAVRLACDMSTRSGKRFKAGTLWRVARSERGALVIRRIDAAGRDVPGVVYVTGIAPHDLNLAPEITPRSE